jgi:DNA-binding NarL/FixJ family response regulator
MNKQITTYLVLKNDLLCAGLKDLLKSNFDTEVVVLQQDENLSKELAQKNLNPQILIYQQEVRPWRSRYLHELLKNNPHLRTFIVTGKVNFKNIKFLFNIGVHGIINKDDSSEEYIKLLNKVLNDRKCLSKEFKRLVMNEFYRPEENFNLMDQQKANEKKLHLGREESFFQMSDCYDLTNRQREVLSLICDGLNTEAIATELFISTHTAETHRRNLLRKMGVKNTAEMVKTAILNKLIAS